MLLKDLLPVVDEYCDGIIDFVYENFDTGENENGMIRINHPEEWNELIDEEHLSWKVGSISLLGDKFYIGCGKV